MRFFLLLIAAVFTLSGCYHPLYGGKGFSAAPNIQEQRLNGIFIGAIDGEGGQKLRNNLIDRMYGQGRPAKPAYRLEVKLTITREKLGLQKDAVTTRARLDVRADYALFNSANKKVFTNTTRSVVAYNILDQEYATLSAREDAFDRAFREIADLMVNRLLLYLGEGK